MATIKPTNPASPRPDTSAVMFPTTSPTKNVSPKTNPATTPNPNRLTKIDVSPPTNEWIIFIALSINEYLLFYITLAQEYEEINFSSLLFTFLLQIVTVYWIVNTFVR